METKFPDLIKNGKIPALAQKIHQIIGIPISIHDVNGKTLCSFGEPDICKTFHRLDPEGKKYCKESCQQIDKIIKKKNTFHINKCKYNINHAAAPITIAGKHLASFHIESFFLEEPNLQFFTKQAKMFGFEIQPFLDTVKNTPVITQPKLENILSLLDSLLELIKEMWMDELERQKTIIRLEESEERYRELVENANSIIMRKNPKGKITFFNEFAEKFFGFSKEEVLGKSVIETIVPGTDSVGRDLKKMVKEIIDTPENYINNENENICKNGRRVWVSWTNKAILDQNGKLKELLCIGNDITNHKKTANEVKESKEFLENIFNSTLDGIIVCNKKGNIESINSATEQILGYSIADLKEKNLSILNRLNKKYANKAYKAWEKLIKNGSHENLETLWTKKDGSPCPVEINSRLIRDPEENILKSITSIRDISKRKKVEETSAQLEIAIEQASEIVVIISTEGEIKYVNPAMEKATGYSPEAMIGSTPFLVNSEKHDYTFYEEIMNAVEKGKTWKGNMTPLKTDGSTCELEMTLTPLRDTSGKITSYVAIARDITNELKLKNQLRQTQKMEAIGLLAGGIAHDFNNILGAVIGFTEMAHYDAPEDSSMKYNLEKVLESCVRAKSLVKQILAFSRQSKEDRIPTYIHLIIKETIKLIRASLPSTIEIKHNIESQEDMMLADTTQVYQLIMNLCTNAGHTMRENGGVLTINLASIHIDKELAAISTELTPGDYIELTVSDTGSGISPNIIDHIFEPFFTTKAVGEGTGMGLTAVKAIIKNHNGSISVNSEPGRGTAFHVFLPKAQKNIKHKPEKQSPPPLSTGKEHILMVDDETLLISVGKRMLSSLGYTVTAETDSNRAFELFKKAPNSFDLLVTDQTMPHLTGYALSKKIMKIRPDLPIILWSGYSEPLSEQKAKAIGIKEYLIKPVSINELAKTIRKILDNN